jgi:protein MAK11
MENMLEIIVGSYEEFLLGYNLTKKKKTYQLVQTFTNHSHCASIRSVAVTSKYLASGSSDETIKLFNLKRRSEIGGLIEHSGTVNSLQFWKNSHLFSAGDDGKLCLFKTKGWECMRTLLGHKESITSLAVHPSGKLALTVSKDKHLRTWNLIKGRSAFITNLKTVAELVLWSPDGSLYAIASGNNVTVYKVETAGVINVIDFGKKVLAVSFVDNNRIAIGGEGENIEIHRADIRSVQCFFKAHSNRVKGLQCVKSLDEENCVWLVSASSDGFIKIWNLHLEKLDETPELVTQVNTTCRITCLVVSDHRVQEGAVKQENPLLLEVKEEPASSDNEEPVEVKDEQRSSESEDERANKKETGDKKRKLSTDQKKGKKKRKQKLKMACDDGDD